MLTTELLSTEIQALVVVDYNLKYKGSGMCKRPMESSASALF